MAEPNWALWWYLSGFIIIMLIYGHGVYKNIGMHWHNPRGRFVSVVAPGTAVLLLVFVGGTVATFGVLMIPDPELIYKSPYDEGTQWVIVPQVQAVICVLVAVTALTMLLGTYASENKHENRTAFLLIMSLFYIMLQILLEGTAMLPANDLHTGWDHQSPLESWARFLFRYFTWPLAAIHIIEIFSEERVVTMMRFVMTQALAFYFFVLMVAFGTDWCSDLDDSSQVECLYRVQRVNMYILVPVVVLCYCFSMLFLSIFWFKWVPVRVLMWCMPARDAFSLSELTEGASRERASRRTRRNAASRAGPYHDVDEDDEVIGIDGTADV